MQNQESLLQSKIGADVKDEKTANDLEFYYQNLIRSYEERLLRYQAMLQVQKGSDLYDSFIRRFKLKLLPKVKVVE